MEFILPLSALCSVLEIHNFARPLLARRFRFIATSLVLIFFSFTISVFAESTSYKGKKRRYWEVNTELSKHVIRVKSKSSSSVTAAITSSSGSEVDVIANLGASVGLNSNWLLNLNITNEVLVREGSSSRVGSIVSSEADSVTNHTWLDLGTSYFFSRLKNNSFYVAWRYENLWSECLFS